MSVFKGQKPTAPRKDAGADEFAEAVSPEHLEIAVDRVMFPESLMLPLTVRAHGVPGLPNRPWSQLSAEDFLGSTPLCYSIALQREPPDRLRSSLRARRTLFEGVLMALAEKTGRRPSRAEHAADEALDEAESRLAMGDAAFRAAVLTALYSPSARPQDAETARLHLETRLKTKGFRVQRLAYIAERAIEHLQPGGELFPGIQEPVLMEEEAADLLPRPGRRVLPAADSVWIGTAARDGHDVYFSPTAGFDPDAPRAPHATTLLLGEMGSGKTSLMRAILVQRLLQGRTVISIDPEGENSRLCAAYGGRVVPAGQPEDPTRCLLHPLVAETAGEMLFAARFLFASLDPVHHLGAQTQAALHDIIQDFWLARPGQRLSLSELSDALREKQGEGIRETAALLHPFKAGGLWEGFFDRKHALLEPDMFSSGRMGTRWWNFDLSNLREENRSIIQSLLTWFMVRLTNVTSAPIDIFIDEGWRLLRSADFFSMLDELGRRARKRGIGVMLATHLPDDFSGNPGSLGLASTAFIGRISPSQAARFLNQLGIPAEHAGEYGEQIGRLPQHVFYAVPGGGRSNLFPVQVRLPPGWLADWERHGAAR